MTPSPRLTTCLLAAAAFTGACVLSDPKEPLDDTFEHLEGGKADDFHNHILVLGELVADAPDVVEYWGTPRYLAYTILGGKGDEVDLWVRSDDGDAVAWLLDDNFRILAANDDAAEGTLDSNIVATLPKEGGYYLVFREYYGEAATFEVSLTVDGERKEPVPPTDHVYPESCGGDRITFSEALTHFDTAADTSRPFDYDVSLYHRLCNDHTGCTPWETRGREYLQYRELSDEDWPTGTMTMFLPSDREIVTAHFKPHGEGSSAWRAHNFNNDNILRAGTRLSLRRTISPNGYVSEVSNNVYTRFARGGGSNDVTRMHSTQLTGVITSDCLRLATDLPRREGSTVSTYRLVVHGDIPTP